MNVLPWGKIKKIKKREKKSLSTFILSEVMIVMNSGVAYDNKELLMFSLWIYHFKKFWARIFLLCNPYFRVAASSQDILSLHL